VATHIFRCLWFLLMVCSGSWMDWCKQYISIYKLSKEYLPQRFGRLVAWAGGVQGCFVWWVKFTGNISAIQKFPYKTTFVTCGMRYIKLQEDDAVFPLASHSYMILLRGLLIHVDVSWMERVPSWILHSASPCSVLPSPPVLVGSRERDRMACQLLWLH